MPHLQTAALIDLARLSPHLISAIDVTPMPSADGGYMAAWLELREVAPENGSFAQRPVGEEWLMRAHLDNQGRPTGHPEAVELSRYAARGEDLIVLPDGTTLLCWRETQELRDDRCDTVQEHRIRLLHLPAGTRSAATTRSLAVSHDSRLGSPVLAMGTDAHPVASWLVRQDGSRRAQLHVESLDLDAIGTALPDLRPALRAVALH